MKSLERRSMKNHVAVAMSILFLVEAALGQTVYNVKTYGAAADGKTKDTAAFQKALDTCAVNGGGVVVVPAGNFLIGSVQMGTRTLLRLDQDGVFAGAADAAAYPMIDVRWEGRWQPG